MRDLIRIGSGTAVRNVGIDPINLENVRLVQVDRAGTQEGIRFSFDAQVLKSNETLLVVRNHDAFNSRYGTDFAFARGMGDVGQMDVFSGELADGGETLTILGPNDGIIQQFTYDDAWYPSTNGVGDTLEFIDTTLADPSAWNHGENWQPSGPENGTPSAPPAVIGDSNLDGIFDQSDLTLVFQAGKYEDEEPNNAIWADGDWNSDGDFTTSDLVAAFIASTFIRNARPIGMPSLSIQAAVVDSIFEDDQKEMPFSAMDYSPMQTKYSWRPSPSP